MDSAVNINLPSSRQPRRRVSAPRPRSRLRWPPCPSPLERLAHSGAPGSRRPSPAARRAAAAASALRDPNPARPPVPPRSGPAASGEPKAQARQGLKETRPPPPQNGFEQVRGRAGRPRKGEAEAIGRWGAGRGNPAPPPLSKPLPSALQIADFLSLLNRPFLLRAAKCTTFGGPERPHA